MLITLRQLNNIVNSFNRVNAPKVATLFRLLIDELLKKKVHTIESQDLLAVINKCGLIITAEELEPLIKEAELSDQRVMVHKKIFGKK